MLFDVAENVWAHWLTRIVSLLSDSLIICYSTINWSNKRLHWNWFERWNYRYFFKKPKIDDIFLIIFSLEQ